MRGLNSDSSNGGELNFIQAGVKFYLTLVPPLKLAQTSRGRRLKTGDMILRRESAGGLCRARGEAHSRMHSPRYARGTVAAHIKPAALRRAVLHRLPPPYFVAYLAGNE